MSVALLIEWNVDWDEARTATAEDAAHFVNIPGLQWKIWIHDQQEQLVGGLYLFSDRGAAETFLTAISEHFQSQGLSVSARILSIDEANSRITRAPLDTAPA